MGKTSLPSSSSRVFALVVTSLLLLTASRVSGQTASACGTSVQALLENCLRPVAISDANFLWFATNGSSSRGAVPTDQAAFKTQICSQEQKISMCVFSQAANLFNTTACQGQQSIFVQLQGLFQTTNLKCAHPCRGTLMADLRTCFTNNSLNGELFLGNQTNANIIGSTENDISNFCAKKDALFACMKTVAQNCPESNLILQAVSFDIPSYEKSVSIPCAKSKVYFMGLGCFNTPTPAVEQCAQKHAQAFLQKSFEAQQQNWTQERFLKETCDNNIRQTDCDLTAWSVKKHEACSPDVITLRRDMECSLIPPRCALLQNAAVHEICNKIYSPISSGQSSNASIFNTTAFFHFVFLILLSSLYFPIKKMQ